MPEQVLGLFKAAALLAATKRMRIASRQALFIPQCADLTAGAPGEHF